MHGYDVTDPTRVNPELGGEDGPAEPCRGAACRRARPDRRYRAEPHGRGRDGESLVGRCAATWPREPLCDVLRHRLGPVHGKVLAPFLGEPYGEALRDGAITLARDGGRPVIRYFDNCFPIRPEDHAEITAARRGRVRSGNAGGEATAASPAGTPALSARLVAQRG